MLRFRAMELRGKTAIAVVVATWLLMIEGCGATDHEPCTQKDIAMIVAAHEARLASKCVGQGENCSERKAEDARFKEELRAWVRCDDESEAR